MSTPGYIEDNVYNNDNALTFERLAVALADDYETLYVINCEDDSYVEYGFNGQNKELEVRSAGADFYADTVTNCRRLVYPEDQEKFLDSFKKEKVFNVLNVGRSFLLGYRLVFPDGPKYYSLKVIRTKSTDKSYIVVGVQNVDEAVRLKTETEKKAEYFSEIASTLATLFEVIYHIDVNTGKFAIYSFSEGFARLGLIKEGDNFFEAVQKDMVKVIAPEDLPVVSKALRREELLSALADKGSIILNYSQMLEGRQQHVRLVVSQDKSDSEHIVIGVRNVDEQIRHENSLKQENETFGEIVKALAVRYEVIYHVNIDTGAYKVYCSNNKAYVLGTDSDGKDFFIETQRNMLDHIHPDDYPMMANAMRKEMLLDRLSELGTTTLNYRLIVNGMAQYMTLFAIRPMQDSDYVIIAVENVDAVKRRELRYREALGSAMDMANRDALTGVKNKHAYVQVEIEYDEMIAGRTAEDFAVVVADINGLKRVNDTQGHNAGDDYIKAACHLICTTFKHSPVYRIGGDEFVILLKGQDYDHREVLTEQFIEVMKGNHGRGLVTVAIGLADFDRDEDNRLQDVFERADSEMYLNKKQFR
ncbi:MAG: GGDEF domain-containing protein [Ruminococcus sp.]|nr:GGDEF domain-containing protein [Ruminococcus sp.]